MPHSLNGLLGLEHHDKIMRISLLTAIVLFSQCPTQHLLAGCGFVETIDGVSFTMKDIPGGEFVMGYSTMERLSLSDESADIHSQNIQRTEVVDSFFMAETESTWALYQLCIDEGACPDNHEAGGDNGWGKDMRPVIEVSWNDITESFIPWLNTKTGRTYRIPTEVEWEYAARAGSRTLYSWGDDIDRSQARYGYVSEKTEDRVGTVPVKSYAPNAFGLYDMHGNVWEWVSDCWTEPSVLGIELHKDNETCPESVLKGGSWLNRDSELHSAFRSRHDRTYRENGDGFRLALSK